jgi:hypothetical protein
MSVYICSRFSSLCAMETSTSALEDQNSLLILRPRFHCSAKRGKVTLIKCRACRLLQLGAFGDAVFAFGNSNLSTQAER